MLVLANGIVFNKIGHPNSVKATKCFSAHPTTYISTQLGFLQSVCSASGMCLGGRNTKQIPDRSWNMEFIMNMHLLRPSHYLAKQGA